MRIIYNFISSGERERLCCYADVMGVDIFFGLPILSQLFSISFLCLKYMGQTWPSNRPGGSGTVYVLVLQESIKSH